MKVEDWNATYGDEVAAWRYEPAVGLQRPRVGPRRRRRDARSGPRHGLGESFLRAQLEYASSSWQPATFRLFVAAWNERAIRLYQRFGFRETARQTRRFELVGEHEFIQMERAARRSSR